MTGPTSGNGELEKSYISVTLKSDDSLTRAEDSFDYGEEAERYVENVHFFLFKEDGSAFPVNPAEGKNYLSFNLGSNATQPGETGNPNEGPNVSDVKDKILVLNNYKGEYPTHIVAVLNWESTKLQPSYSMKSLYNTLVEIRNTSNHFVMSTSVYADLQGKVINTNVLTIDNIGKSEEEAKAHPVEIYVERISAKIQVEAKGDVSGKNATYDVDETADGIQVYAQVQNWELYNEYHHSIVIKHIYPETWGMNGQIGFLWNDPNRFRSYWAKSYSGDFPSDNSFNLFGMSLEPGTGTAYCGENTRQAEKDSEGNITSDPRTKVIIKAQLVAEDGTPVEVCSWYGHKYVGEQAVRTEVASLLANQIFYADGSGYEPISADDLKAVPANEAPSDMDIKPYEVFFQLMDTTPAKEWYIYSNKDGFKASTKDEINARLAKVEPAMVYKDGMTYYFTEIRHSGSAGSSSEYGVVRNHVYRVNISQIKGLGTPVYDKDINIETPQRPIDKMAYVAAEVRILSWRMVKNNYSVE